MVQVERLNKRYEKEPLRLFEETQQLYRKNGIRFMTPGSFASAAIQIPLLGALFSAVRTGLGARVRFLWIADLSRVDGLLLILVTSLAGFAAAFEIRLEPSRYDPAEQEEAARLRAFKYLDARWTLEGRIRSS